MNQKTKIIIIAITLIIGILLINQLKYRNDELYAVNLKNKIDKDLVSILVSDGSNNYTNYEGDAFPSNTEYTYNSELSKCQDNNGNVIEGILSYDETGKVSIRTKKTTYCYLYFDKKSISFSEELIASGELWQSGLEGDGYRYTGTGVTCSYDNGKFIGPANNQQTSPSCPTLYNYTRTTISSGATTNYTYKTSCPSNTSTYTYSCIELNGTVNTASLIPNNFICFGTNSLEECKANENKYMYRIIGVFPDEFGEQHLKLIKYKQLGAYMWHSEDIDISWEASDLYKGLNGISGGGYSNLFIGNTTYDYLQENNLWYEKIADWKWTATNTLTYSNSGADYRYSLIPSDIYLHEMNRSTKTSDIGSWTYLETKIGLMYASDYTLSLGSNALSMTGSTDANEATLKTGWLNPLNNDTTADTWEWFISRRGKGNPKGNFGVWEVGADGDVDFGFVYNESGVRPVFYLDSNVTTIDGNGEYSTPYLLN